MFLPLMGFLMFAPALLIFGFLVLSLDPSAKCSVVNVLGFVPGAFFGLLLCGVFLGPIEGPGGFCLLCLISALGGRLSAFLANEVAEKI